MRRETITVGVDTLREYMVGLLAAAGCDGENARQAAEGFLEADLRGVGLQGLDHMTTLLEALRDGRVDPAGRPRIADERAATALVDGGRGPGQAAGCFAADLAVRKAREAGCCTVAVTNSFDLFMVGWYAERIARAGMVGLVFSDAPPLVRTHGGAERALGTNPLAIAVPRDGEAPLVLDLATSALSASRVRQAAYHGEAVPDAEGVDAGGRPSDDAAAVRAGAIGPLAGHKGFGLALCVALLAGPLTGSDTGRALRAVAGAPPPRKGHLLIAIDPAAFGDPGAFRRAAGDFLREIAASRRLPGVDAIRIPGERSHRAREAALASGEVSVLAAVWEKMAGVAADLGVTPPEVAR